MTPDYDVIVLSGGLRDTIQPFPSFSQIHASALKALRQEIAAAPRTAPAGSR